MHILFVVKSTVHAYSQTTILLLFLISPLFFTKTHHVATANKGDITKIPTFLSGVKVPEP